MQVVKDQPFPLCSQLVRHTNRGVFRVLFLHARWLERELDT